MRWKTALFLVSALGTPSASVNALGLGNIQLQSSLNEPFRARINLAGAGRDELDSLRISLAGGTEFKRAGVDRAHHLSKLRFQLVQPGGGADYIQVTSHEPIREPFLDFLIELNWAKGRVVREFAVLLDPPGRRAPASRPARRSRAAADESAGYEPSAESVAAGADERETAGGSGGSARRGGGAGSYGPTRSSDTLWAIANRVRPGSSVSVPQMMMALLRANPQAFIRNNINNLKRGKVLRIPSRGVMESLSRAQAWAEVKQHNALWENYRQGVGSDVPIQAQSAPEPSPTPAETPPPAPAATPRPATSTDPRLRVLGTESKPPATAGAGTADQALVNEELAAQKQQNADVQKRVKDAEVLIEQLQRLVKLKDDQLAAMQGKTAGPAATAPGAEASAAQTPAAGATLPAGTSAAEPPKPPAEVPSATTPLAATPSTPTVAAPPKPIPKPEPAPEAAMGFMDKVRLLVPESVADSVPGGALSVLLGSLALLAGLVWGLLRLFGRRGAAEEELYLEELSERTLQPGVTPADSVVLDEQTAELAPLPRVDELAATGESTSTFELPVSTTQPIEVPASLTSTRAPAAFQEADPLETVNVYLAYERFEQAEELVKKALENDPNNPKYMLRLLEVYYAADNKQAYEQAAYKLHDLVGGQGGMWDSGVAMWYAMSPGRGLFEAGDPGDLDMSSTLTRRAKSIVDITSGESLEAGPDLGDTVTTPPGDTQLRPAWDATTSITDADLDFNIMGRSEDEDDSILDLTGGTAGGLAEMFDLGTGDLTQTSVGKTIPAVGQRAATGDVLDLTNTGTFSIPKQENLLDLTVSRREKTAPMSEPPSDMTMALSDSTVRLPHSEGDDIAAVANELSEWTQTGDEHLRKLMEETSSGNIDFDLGASEDEDIERAREQLSRTVDRMEVQDLTKAAGREELSLVLTDPMADANPAQRAMIEVDEKLQSAKFYFEASDLELAKTILKELPDELTEAQELLRQELRGLLKK